MSLDDIRHGRQIRYSNDDIDDLCRELSEEILDGNSYLFDDFLIIIESYATKLFDEYSGDEEELKTVIGTLILTVLDYRRALTDRDAKVDIYYALMRRTRSKKSRLDNIKALKKTVREISEMAHYDLSVSADICVTPDYINRVNVKFRSTHGRDANIIAFRKKIQLISDLIGLNIWTPNIESETFHRCLEEAYKSANWYLSLYSYREETLLLPTMECLTFFKSLHYAYNNPEILIPPLKPKHQISTTPIKEYLQSLKLTNDKNKEEKEKIIKSFIQELQALTKERYTR